MTSSDPGPIISQRSLGGVVLACVALAACFIPDQNELIHRLDQDGESVRLQALTAKRLAAREELLVSGTDRQKLHVWLELNDVELRDDPVILADRRSLCACTKAPLELGEELFAHAVNIDPATLDSFADSLVKRALGLERPGQAAALLDSWSKIHPSLDLTARSVEAWRWAGKPEKAFIVIDQALKRSPEAPPPPAEWEELRIQLALESNHPQVAFALVQQKYRAAADRDKAALLSRLVDMAPQTGNVAEAAELIAEQVKTLPFHTASLPQAIEMLRNHEAFLNPEQQARYVHYAGAMARWQEWGDHADIALDTWFHLALLGNEEGWTRALDIQEDILRMDDFSIVLEELIKQGQHLDQEPTLAAVLLAQGKSAEAMAHYEHAAKSLADPSPVLVQLGRIHEQSGEWAEAIASFDEVLKRNSTHVEAIKGKAFCLVRLGRFDEACADYVAVARKSTDDAELQETCATLCDSLGRSREALEATGRLLACSGRKSTPEEHLDLADQYRFLGDVKGQTEVLRKAMAQFADSSRIRFTLAEALGTQGQHDEAMQLVADRSLLRDPKILNLLINEGLESSNPAVAADLVALSQPASLAALPSLRLRLAYLYEKAGRPADSLQIVADLQKNAAFKETNVWQDLARICVDFDDVTRAESFALLYISAIGNKDSKAWELLGDIYTAEDRLSDADIAYKKAVEMLGTVTLRAEPVSPEFSQAKAF